jgi:hypothetical protein
MWGRVPCRENPALLRFRPAGLKRYPRPPSSRMSVIGTSQSGLASDPDRPLQHPFSSAAGTSHASRSRRGKPRKRVARLAHLGRTEHLRDRHGPTQVPPASVGCERVGIDDPPTLVSFCQGAPRRAKGPLPDHLTVHLSSDKPGAEAARMAPRNRSAARFHAPHRAADC